MFILKVFYTSSIIGISILWLLLYIAIKVEHTEKKKQGRIRKEKPINQIIIEGIVSTIKIVLSIVVPVWNTIMFIIVLVQFDKLLEMIPEQLEALYEPKENSI